MELRIWLAPGGDVNVHDLVAGGEYGDLRLAINQQASAADGSGHCNRGMVKPHSRRQQPLAAFGFGTGEHDVFTGGDTFCDSHLLILLAGVFHHHHGIGARRHGGSGHDAYGVTGMHEGNILFVNIGRAGFYFAAQLKGNGKMYKIGGADGIAVARGPGKRREGTVGKHWLGQDLSTAWTAGVEQIYQFLAVRMQRGGVMFHQMARLLETQNQRGLRCGSHEG